LFAQPSPRANAAEGKENTDCMTSITESSATGKGKYDPSAGERIYLLHAMQAAIARSRLVTNTLESINVALRHRSINVDQAMHWLREESVLHLVKFGPELSR
jgi:hypothetical protein